jgi:hypothetical protein
MRPYQWQAVADRLHAIPNTSDSTYPPLPGAVYQTVCGMTVELSPEDFRRRVHRGTCEPCIAGWIAQETDDESPQPGRRRS